MYWNGSRLCNRAVNRGDNYPGTGGKRGDGWSEPVRLVGVWGDSAVVVAAHVRCRILAEAVVRLAVGVGVYEVFGFGGWVAKLHFSCQTAGRSRHRHQLHKINS
jgi:hypothetical protein